MPVSLAQIASNSATVTLHFQAGDLTIEYYPLKITDEMLAQLMSWATVTDADAALANFRHLNEMMVEIIKFWDLLGQDDQIITLTVPHMSRLSPILKLLIVQEIQRDIRPEAMTPRMNGKI
jgi:hypothetical protein